MPSVLVTGGAGYVGSVCCSQLLERGHEVTVVDNLSTGHPDAVPAGAEFRPVDIGDRNALAEVLSERHFDIVFHFAAKALIPESVSNPGSFFDSNVASGIAMLETLRSAGIERIVLSSTAAVYGNPTSVPIDEHHAKNPVNSYGESKLMLERVLHWYAAAYGWTVVCFRYFNASGATATIGEDHRPETHIIPVLLQTAEGKRDLFEVYGEDYPTPDGTCLRDYVHVLDIAEAHLLALNIPQRPGIDAYNIGTGRSHSVREVLKAVEDVVGKKLRTRMSPRRPGDPAILCASPQRLMRDLGWQPRFSDLRGIVESAWNWMNGHPNGYSEAQSEVSEHARS
jgi:UDP-glucose 4-epimerase